MRLFDTGRRDTRVPEFPLDRLLVPALSEEISVASESVGISLDGLDKVSLSLFVARFRARFPAKRVQSIDQFLLLTL